MILRSPGLRLSLCGAVVFLISALALIVLPSALPAIGMLTGGMAVWAGFIWTIFGYYGSNAGPNS